MVYLSLLSKHQNTYLKRNYIAICTYSHARNTLMTISSLWSEDPNDYIHRMVCSPTRLGETYCRTKTSFILKVNIPITFTSWLFTRITVQGQREGV